VARASRRESRAGARATLFATLSILLTGSRLIVHKVKIEKNFEGRRHSTAEVDVEKRDATRRNHTAIT